MASEDRRRGSASTIEAEARDGGGRELGWLPVAELLEEAPFPDRDIGPALDSLASSVRLHGILSPLVVRRGPNGRLQVVCGWRRLLAARDAGEERVPVLMVDMGDAEAIRCWLSESSFRRDIDHETRERALRMLRDVHDRAIDSDERATEIGTPPSRFERTLEDRVTDEISVGPESFAIRGIPGDRLSSEREDGDTETLEARFESLVS
ncbi:MAG TPA: ParB N-terminal domain-containing protein, partial [Planctomycetota bacterium]|nr:ParB N-terminal domain-containing protein [Planctomycetota bacterium]